MGWESIRKVLQRLTVVHPSPLLGHPPLDDDVDHPLPVRVGLAPWALDLAAELDGTFGPDIELVVGFLRYPTRQRFAYPGSPLRPPQHYPTFDPDELSVQLLAPMVVASGHDLWTSVRIGNQSDAPVTLLTNGHISGRVVDRHGEGIGGSAAVERTDRVHVHIDPQESHPVSLAVGTASLEPDLGYAVPAGRWGVDFLLHLDDGRLVRSPALLLTIT